VKELFPVAGAATFVLIGRSDSKTILPFLPKFYPRKKLIASSIPSPADRALPRKKPPLRNAGFNRPGLV